MDDIDLAQARQAQDINLALAAHKPKQKTGSGSDTCLECGELIPEARREAQPGCVLCVNCQAIIDEFRGDM